MASDRREFTRREISDRVRKQLEAIREAQSDDYVMSKEEVDAVVAAIADAALKTYPTVKPKFLPAKPQQEPEDV